MNSTTTSLSSAAVARKVLLPVLLLLGLATCPSCTTNGMVTHVQQIRVGMGGNGVGHKEFHQYYFFFGFFRLNEVNIEREVANYTSYDVTTGCSYGDWFWTTLLFPFLVSRDSVRVDW